MYKVGIIGARVGGCYLSWLLSKKGLDTIIFDFRAPMRNSAEGWLATKQ